MRKTGPEDGRGPTASPEEVATYLGVPVQTLYMWRYRKVGPLSSKIGRHVRYRWQDVDCWFSENAVGQMNRPA